MQSMAESHEPADSQPEMTTFQVLAVLAARGQPMSTFAIGCEVRDASRPMSVVIGILSAGGFIEAAADRGKRTKLWSLTPKGVEAVERRRDVASDVFNWLMVQPRFSHAEANILRALWTRDSRELQISDLSTSRGDVRSALMSLQERLLIESDETAVKLTPIGVRDIERFGLPSLAPREGQSVLRFARPPREDGFNPGHFGATDFVKSAWLLIDRWDVTKEEKLRLLQMRSSPFEDRDTRAWKTPKSIQAAKNAMKLTIELERAFGGKWADAAAWLRGTSPTTAQDRLTTLIADDWITANVEVSGLK